MDLERLAQVGVYLIDVGEMQPRNAAIRAIRLSRQKIPTGGNLLVQGTVQVDGESPGTLPLRLLLNDAQGKPVQRGRVDAKVESGQPATVEFEMLTGLVGNVVHGEVRIESSDPLSFDDAQFFTIEVGDPTPVLVVALDEAVAFEWLVAAPSRSTTVSTEKNRFAVTFATPQELETADLQKYQTVYLVNVPGPSDAVWSQLDRFVDAGGGLGILLGAPSPPIKPETYNRPKAQIFLPGQLSPRRPRAGTGSSWSTSIRCSGSSGSTRGNGSFAITEQEVSIFRFWRARARRRRAQSWPGTTIPTTRPP